jgi:hypothetical protein
MLKVGFERPWLKPWKEEMAELPTVSNVSDYIGLMSNRREAFFKFQPSKGWRGQIEIT